MKTLDSLAILGVGLIGGSIGLRVRAAGLARRVVGIGRRQSSLQAALQRGAVDEVTTSVADGVRQADLIVVCAPVESIVPLVAQIDKHCLADALITDVGSTKASIVQQLAAAGVPAQGLFIGSHPMAGSEKAGVQAARADLFEGRKVVITPSPDHPPEAVARLRQFWESLGSQVVRLTAQEHDETVASISHLPHLVATALAAATPSGHLPLAASGWSDTTRIAAGDVELWRQILRQNRSQLLSALDRFDGVLCSFREALVTGNDQQLIQCLEAGKKQRDSLGN